MSITADPLFVAAEVQWRTENLSSGLAHATRAAAPRPGDPHRPPAGAPPAPPRPAHRRSPRGPRRLTGPPRVATALELAETHDTLSDHSDIIGVVGFERSAAGLFVGRDDEADQLARLLGIDATTPRHRPRAPLRRRRHRQDPHPGRGRRPGPCARAGRCSSATAWARPVRPCPTCPSSRCSAGSRAPRPSCSTGS